MFNYAPPTSFGLSPVCGVRCEDDPVQRIMESLRPEKTVMEISGYEVTFIPGFQGHGMSYDGVNQETLEYDHGKVIIGNDRLIVNDRDYGKLQKQDTVLIKDGEVTVSGRKREKIRIADTN